MSGITLHIARLSVDSRRKMHGIAYSGGVLYYCGDHIAIDLDTLRFDGRQVPLLHNHDRNRYVGFGWLTREGNALAVNGEMLTNEHADAIIQAAEEGLEWQMSVHIESDRVLTRHAGDVVNGQALDVDDVIVFANGIVREVSFTPTGVDADTKATILSLSLNKEAIMPKDDNQNAQLSADIAAKDAQIGQLSADVAAKDARIAELAAKDARIAELAAKDARIAELEQQIESDRTTARLSQLKALGVDDTRAATLAKADADTYAALVDQLQLSAKQQAVLGTSYDGGEPQQRKNPLLRKK